MAMLSAEAILDPGFRLPLAAVERWAREVYLATAAAPAKPPPKDALTGQELAKIHRILTDERSEKVVRGPGRALLDGLKALGYAWPLPHVLRRCGAADGDLGSWDLTMTPPAMLRGDAKRTWE